jgi:hypothetical protein
LFKWIVAGVDGRREGDSLRMRNVHSCENTEVCPKGAKQPRICCSRMLGILWSHAAEVARSRQAEAIPSIECSGGQRAGSRKFATSGSCAVGGREILGIRPTAHRAPVSCAVGATWPTRGPTKLVVENLRHRHNMCSCVQSRASARLAWTGKQRASRIGAKWSPRRMIDDELFSDGEDS